MVKINDVIRESNTMETLIDAGLSSIYFSVLEGDFEKAKSTADEVKGLKEKLKSYQDRWIKFV